MGRWEDRFDGEDRICRVNLRILTAINRNLEKQVGASRFRQALHFG
jgi:transcriptional regulator with GAF, ATPase, and Fis domain